jgi:hypothetical protein
MTKRNRLTFLLTLSAAIFLASCMKHEEAPAGSKQNSGDPNELVLTPAGYMKRSNVHYLDNNNFRLSVVNGRWKTVSKATGEIADDFGEAPRDVPGGAKLSVGQKKVKVGSSEVVPGPLSTATWACYGYLESANYGYNNPIQSFSTTWNVPGIPQYDGQTIMLFNGAMNGTPGSATAILQPVLQFGPTAAGGGDYWAITNWYVYNGGTSAIYGSLVEVSPSTVLTGVMGATLEGGGLYTYTSQFTGYSSTDITVPDVAPCNYPVEAMEVVNYKTAADYPQPPTEYEGMRSMNIAIEGNAGFLLWQVADNFANANEHAIVYSNSPSAGEIDLYWHAAFNPYSTRNNSIDFSDLYPSQYDTITAYYNKPVQLNASVSLYPPGTYSVYIEVGGVTFTKNTSGSSPDVLTATSSLNNTLATFNMPNAYQVYCYSDFSYTNNNGEALITVSD